jgi:hypothetical protein
MSDEKKEFSFKPEKVEEPKEEKKAPKKGPVYGRKGSGPLYIVKE